AVTALGVYAISFYGGRGALVLAVLGVYLLLAFVAFQLVLWPLAVFETGVPARRVLGDAGRALLARPLQVLALTLVLALVNAAGARDIAMVFQSYALYPHMTVYDNLAFGLRNQGLPRKEVDRRVQEAAQILDLGALLKRKPKQLSGGQRQRVALGRAIVREPS